MKPIVYRQSGYFKLNVDLLPGNLKTTQVMNDIYKALFVEFQGSIHKDEYKNLSYSEKMQKAQAFVASYIKRKYKYEINQG